MDAGAHSHSGIDNPAERIDFEVGNRSEWDGDVIAGVAAVAGADQGAFAHQVCQVARGGGRRRTGDGDVISSAQAPFEAVRACFQHSEQRFLLAVVQDALQTVE